MKRIHVQYFAIFRERRGVSEEVVETQAATAADLYDELADQHALGLPPAMVRVSINLQLGPLDRPIADGDAVVFIPPVAGG